MDRDEAIHMLRDMALPEHQAAKAGADALENRRGKAVMLDLLQHIFTFIGGVGCGLSIAVLVSERRKK